MLIGYCWKSQKETGHWKDQDVGGWTIGWDGVDWIDMAQDRDQWKALVNAVLNFSGSVKCWEVFEWLHKWGLLKKGSAR
jgi:hypothetical protein